MANTDHLEATPTPEEGGERRGRWFRAVAAVISLAIAGSIVYALAGTLGTTSDEVPFGTSDGPESLGEGVSVVIQTGEKRIIQVRIRGVEEEGLAFTATVAGLPEGTTGEWSAVLDDGSELAMHVESRGGSLFAIELIRAVPAGRVVEEVKLDPDASEGEVRFSVN